MLRVFRREPNGGLPSVAMLDGNRLFCEDERIDASNLDRILAADEPAGVRREALCAEMERAGETGREALLRRLHDMLPSGLVLAESSALPVCERRFVPLPDLAGELSVDPSGLPNGIFDPRRRIHEELGQRPSFSGARDKFTAVGERDGATLRLRVPNDGEEGNLIVKPYCAAYPFLAECECACTRMADVCGLDVPQAWTFEEPRDGTEREYPRTACAVARFDLDPIGRKMETYTLHTLHTLAGGTWKDPYDMTTEELFGCARKFLHAPFGCSPNKGDAGDCARLAKAYLFGRLIGNGNMHAGNFSILIQSSRAARLAPIYGMLSTHAVMNDDTLALPLYGRDMPTAEDVADFLIPFMGADRAAQLAHDVARLAQPCIEEVFPKERRGNPVVRTFVEKFVDRTIRRCNAMETTLAEREREPYEGMADSIGLH